MKLCSAGGDKKGRVKEMQGIKKFEVAGSYGGRCFKSPSHSVNLVPAATGISPMRVTFYRLSLR